MSAWSLPPVAGQRARGDTPRTAYDELVDATLADRDVERLERHYEIVAAFVHKPRWRPDGGLDWWLSGTTRRRRRRVA